MNDLASNATAGQRGPADHNVRDQIIAAADEHFSHYGYGKTTVADLAKSIGFSKAYIYKFFDSKQAIGEAICTKCMGQITASVHDSIVDGLSATEKLRLVFKTLLEKTVELCFNDHKIYEMAAYSCAEKWPSAQAYLEEIRKVLTAIVREGREAGEFERKTPIDEAARAIMLAYQSFMNPVMLQYNLDVVPDGAQAVVNLVLRSLAP